MARNYGIRRVSERHPNAQRARELLMEAHDACMKCGVLPLDVVHGKFSGVNEALGLIAELDADLADALAALKEARHG